MIYEFGASASGPRGHEWRGEFEGPPLPSGLAQCFLALRAAEWDAMDADQRERAEGAVKSHAERTRRPLAWRRHPLRGVGTAPGEDMVSVGPLALGGDLHRDVARSVPRAVDLMAFDPIRGAPCDARPPRPARQALGGQPHAEAAPGDVVPMDRRRVVGFRGSFGAADLPALPSPVVVDEAGRTLDDDGAPDDADAGSPHTPIGPWPCAPGHLVLVLAADDVRCILAAADSGRSSLGAEVAPLRPDGAQGGVGGRAVHLPVDGAPGAFAWYAPEAWVRSVRQALSGERRSELWRAIEAQDAARLAAAAVALLRNARVRAPGEDGDGNLFSMDAAYGVAALEMGGKGHAEAVADFDAMLPRMNPAHRAERYRQALNGLRGAWRSHGRSW